MSGVAADVHVLCVNAMRSTTRCAEKMASPILIDVLHNASEFG